MAIEYIPNGFYVGRRAQSADEILGFMTPTATEGFDKRKATVDGWAGKAALSPTTIDNEPKSGFSLAMVIRRKSRFSDTTNWRIIHPEGFEFEISSGVFYEILEECTVECGVIKDELLFIRDGSNNILVKKGSKRHLEAASEEQAFTTVSVKDLAVGDEVVFKNGDSGYVYLGVRHVMYTPDQPEFDRKTDKIIKKDWYNTAKSKRKHFFAPKDNLSSYLRESSSFTLNSIVSRNNVTEEEADKAITEHLSINSEYLHHSDKPISPKKYKVELVEVPFQNTNPDESLIQDYEYQKERYVVEASDGTRCLYHTSRGWSGRPRDHKFEKVELIDVNGTFLYTATRVVERGYYYNHLCKVYDGYNISDIVKVYEMKLKPL